MRPQSRRKEPRARIELHPNSWTGADALISAMSRCEIKSLARSPEWYALFGATFL